MYVLESQVSQEVYENLVLSPKPQQVVFGDGSEDVECIDIRSCRLNSLKEQPYLPVASPADEIKPYDGSSFSNFDYVYIAGCSNDPRRPFDPPPLPYTGKTWRHRDVAIYMQERGLKPIVTHTFTASGRVPIQTFIDALDRCDAAAQEAFGDPKAFKGLVLPMIGLMNKIHRYSLRKARTDCEDDLGTAYLKYFDAQTGLFDMYRRTDHVNFKTYSLIGRIALDGEQVKLARIIDACRARDLDIRGCQVDSVFIPKKPKLGQEIADQLGFCRLKTSDKIPQCKWDRQFADFEMSLMPSQWATDITNASGDFEGLDDQIIANEGALVVGLPGVGKTHLLKAIRDKLLDQGKRVGVTAFQIATAKRIGGSSLLHLMHVGARYDWIIIDEGSQVPTSLYSHLAAMRHVWGTKFAVFADFAQLPPVSDRWQPSLPESGLEDTKLMRGLVGDFKLRLTYNHRCHEDPAHFERVRRLHDTLRGPVPVDYPCYGKPDMIVCLCHKTRVAANEWLNRLNCPGEHLLIEKPKQALDPPQQNMRIWPGLDLIGTRSGKAVENGVVYFVRGYSDSTVSLEDENGNELTLTHGDVATGLRLRHAMTSHQAQGQTFRDKHVWILDVRHRFWTARHHLVAMSRVTHSRYLGVPTPEQSHEILQANVLGAPPA